MDAAAPLDFEGLSHELAARGLRRYIGGDRRLKIGPKERIDADLRDRILANAGRLLAELLIAEAMDWESAAWTREDRARMNREAPADVLARRAGAEMEMHAGFASGNVEAVREAIRHYRTILRAAAIACGIHDASADEPSGEYDPGRER